MCFNLKFLIALAIVITIVEGRDNPLSCYSCTGPPYPGGGIEFNNHLCGSQTCKGLILKQKCVKIIEEIEGQKRYTRACLDDIYMSSHREEIPADTYRGCRPASAKINRPGDPHEKILPKFYNKSFCFCDEWDNCNSSSKISGIYFIPIFTILFMPL